MTMGLLTQYSSGDIDLAHHGDLADGALQEISHPSQLHLEEMKDVGGFYDGALQTVSHGIIEDHALDTVGGFHTIDHYLDDQHDLGFGLEHMPGHSHDAVH